MANRLGEEVKKIYFKELIKKEKHISFSDITSAEICIGYSHKVKGYRLSFAGMRYIVFRNNKKYLFKIIYLPETEEIFKHYL